MSCRYLLGTYNAKYVRQERKRLSSSYNSLAANAQWFVFVYEMKIEMTSTRCTTVPKSRLRSPPHEEKITTLNYSYLLAKLCFNK